MGRLRGAARSLSRPRRSTASLMKHVYNIAIRDGKADTNPVSELQMLRESSGRVRYLTDDEEGRLMAALSTDEDRQRLTVL